MPPLASKSQRSGCSRMPLKIMDQRQLSSSVCLPSAPSSFLSEEICLPAQRQIGFWKTESVPDHRGTQGMSWMSGSKSVSSSPLEKFHARGGRSVEQLEYSQPYFFKDQKTTVNAQHHIMQSETAAGLSKSSWRAADQNYGCQSNFCVQPASLSTKEDKVYLNVPSYENSPFSSSLSDIFDRKLRISSSDVPFGQSTDILNSNFKEDEPFESLEEVEAQTIGNLLPDDDDLLSGVINDLEYIVHPNSGDDVEDDLFCSGGGIELEADTNLNYDKSTDSLRGGLSNCWQGGVNSLFANEHPSRTLFVRNINSSIEDAELRALFEQYGEIHTLYTACKQRGFVMISYCDIRAAQNAMRTLQSKPLRHRKLDIHYSIPKDNSSDKDVNQGMLAVFNLDSSVSNDDLLQTFGAYGEIKEIREIPHKDDHKFIEFYDVRAAEAALDALNGSDIAGKRIKLEPSYPGVARSFLQQLSPELDQKEFGACKQGSPNNNNNPSGCYVSAESIPLGEVTSNILDNGATQGLRSALRAAISPFIENPFHGTSSVSHCSAARVAPIGHSSSQQVEPGNSVGQVNFGIHHAQTFHPHSLPEYHDGLTSGILFNSSSNMSAMPININSRLTDAIDHKYIHRGAGALSHSFEHNEGAFGISATGSCPLHGHQFVWSNSNSYHNHPPGPIIWPNSPSFISSIPAHQPSQIHALQAAPSHMLGTVLPLHHHVGSAPAVNPSLWDRRHPYSGDSIEASGFHPGSLGSIGFPGSPLHPLELASRNMFPHAGGNGLDPSISSSPVGILSSQQRCHMLHGRNPSIPMPVSYDAHSDRVRSRRNDASANNADNKKQFELDIDRIVRGEDSRTTLMIKNIPNKYTSKMLLAAIDEHHRGTYDFIYLPIDFKNKCNVGYAFINMINPQHIIPFYQTFNGKKWEKFNSEKVASLAYARIQGKLALIAHFQNSSLMNEDKRCRPILFRSDGPNAGDQEPFPMGVNVRSRPGRSRTAANEEIHQGSPSNSAIAEESSNTMGSSSGSTKDSEAPKPQPKGEEL